MDWRILALASAALSAAVAICEKKSLFKIDALDFSVLLSIFSFIFALPFLFFFEMSDVSSRAMLFLFIKSIFNAAAFYSVMSALKRLDMIRRSTEHKDKLWTIVNALQSGLKERGFNLGNTESPVTPVILQGGVPEATHVTYDLRENYGIFCSIVVYPVVPKGIILLRLIPTAMHTLEDVEYTINAFTEIKDKLSKGEYADEIKSQFLEQN